MAYLAEQSPALATEAAAHGVADRAELRSGRVAEQADGGDADNSDEGDEQGVLDEAGAPLIVHPGTEPRSENIPLGLDVHGGRSPVHWG